MILHELIAIIDDDRDLVEQLLEAGVLTEPLERDYSDEEAELVRVAHVLLRELEVNLPGVEVILRMRQEVIGLRQQMAEVIRTLQSARR
ncbi:MAG: hypothetical protein JWO36_1229 [Myxococcales bacterium]|nr:hypothetical protein [Myxococcales bacterium]